MLEFTLQLSGDENSEEFRSKVEEIRNFVVIALGGTEFASLEVRSVVGLGYRSLYNYPRIRYSQPIRPSVIPYTFDSQGYVIVSREEAEAILEKLHDIAEQYEVVTVADFKELFNFPQNHLDKTWGWTEVNAEIKQIREGWCISLPSPMVIP